MAKGRKRCRGLRHFFFLKREGRREGKKGKRNTVGAARTHLLSFLILKKRQHCEQTSHWFDLKGERKEGTQKKKKKLEKKIEM